MRKAFQGMVGLALAGFLVACGGSTPDQRDPVTVSRDFMLAVWTGNTAQVEALSCREVDWHFEGNPSLTIDADHLVFDVVRQTDSEAEVTMAGVATFKSPDGGVAIHNFGEEGPFRFTLRRENGWKVCDLHGPDQ